MFGLSIVAALRPLPFYSLCSFTVTRKANSSLHITKDCVGPCIEADEKGCACIAGGSTGRCPAEW
eukprot:scaffold1268_cov133-Skeletonema_marinoi.AAC.1